MEKNSEKFTITLRIGSISFPLTILRDEELVYREAEKLINGKLNYYSERYPNQGKEMYMSMGLLDIAVTLQQENHRNDTEPFTICMQNLLTEMEDVLSGKEK